MQASPKHRYFKQLAAELRKPNFGIQYTVSNVGFLHAAASSLQEESLGFTQQVRQLLEH